MPDRVVVRAPATIANLGPGFDCLGIAIAWHNEVRVERDPSGELTVTVAGQGADAIPRDESNLVVRAIREVYPSVGGMQVHLTNAIPFGRGFGSSAAAIVAGIVAGLALQGTKVVRFGGEKSGPTYTRIEVARFAEKLEGHPDNVSPCAIGGATVVAQGILGIGAPKGIEMLVFVAPMALSTEVARRALPDQVSFKDATANAARAALLAATLEHEHPNPSFLFLATEDVLHQPSRFALSPDAGALVRVLREKKFAAFLAGAGPSVASFCREGQGEELARRLAPDGWDVRRVAIDAEGATVVETDPPLE